jgi:hypothetical protein
MSEAVEQNTVQTVAMVVERPRSRTRLVEVTWERHRSIVAEGSRREQHDRLLSQRRPALDTSRFSGRRSKCPTFLDSAERRHIDHRMVVLEAANDRYC